MVSKVGSWDFERGKGKGGVLLVIFQHGKCTTFSQLVFLSVLPLTLFLSGFSGTRS